MNSTSTEDHPTMNGSAVEDYSTMNGTVTEGHSTMNGTVTEDHPRINGSAAEDHSTMNSTAMKEHSTMNGTVTENHPEMNGEDGLADSLQQWATNLADAAKAYKGASGQQSLLLRSEMSNNARQIINAIKEPGETPFEYSVQMAEMGALRMMMELKIFDKIPQQGSISYADLAASVGAEESLLTRFLWMLVSTGLLNQIGEDQVAHTRLSKTYVDGNPQGAFFQIMFDEGMTTYTKWPEYFEKFGLKEPREGNYVPTTFTWGCEEKNFWEMMNAYPKRLKAFNLSMATLDEVLPVTGMYDYSWIADCAKNGDPSRTLIVDVGSGRGQALKRIMASCPEIPASRLVMQDRPIVIEEAKNTKDEMLMDVKKMPHDFFTEQPVKGALVYFIRRIIHDWHDDNCRIILSHLAKAMDSDSRVLICEQIMSNPPSPLNAQTDLCMLGLGAKERTEKMFQELVASSGLRLIKIWKAEGTNVGVVECAKGEQTNGH